MFRIRLWGHSWVASSFGDKERIGRLTLILKPLLVQVSALSAEQLVVPTAGVAALCPRRIVSKSYFRVDRMFETNRHTKAICQVHWERWLQWPVALLQLQSLLGLSTVLLASLVARPGMLTFGYGRVVEMMFWLEFEGNAI